MEPRLAAQVLQTSLAAGVTSMRSFPRQPQVRSKASDTPAPAQAALSPGGSSDPITGVLSCTLLTCRRRRFQFRAPTTNHFLLVCPLGLDGPLTTSVSAPGPFSYTYNLRLLLLATQADSYVDHPSPLTNRLASWSLFLHRQALPFVHSRFSRW